MWKHCKTYYLFINRSWNIGRILDSADISSSVSPGMLFDDSKRRDRTPSPAAVGAAFPDKCVAVSINTSHHSSTWSFLLFYVIFARICEHISLNLSVRINREGVSECVNSMRTGLISALCLNWWNTTEG